MTKKKLVINSDLDEKLIKEIQQEIPDWQVIAHKDPEKITQDLAEAEIVLHWKRAAEQTLLANRDLKWVQTFSAGVNSLPLDRLIQNNVKLTSANGVHGYPISETIFALMLALTRKIHTYVRQQKEKTWHKADIKLEIHQKTIGILGVGAIGRETARISKAFGMKVLGMRHSGKNIEDVDEMFTPDQLSDLLPKCDYVVITLPLTDETTGMFGKEAFRQMKNSAFLINIGRGKIINEKELIQALENGEIAGAGLDVFEKEPLSEDSSLWEMENVIITPHTAGATEHYDERVIRDIFIPNLREYLESDAPTLNVVDYEKGY
ncbi:Phosphoglycerate dehydrogenase [Gracilibacillus ureilyticus]|uniref:Phosphoglycerate dehydrogenase n=1 Tax=Gracilibacillus ureilyticus TaxID=531814 RepID=A0A1H9S9G2_9BACI|nr:D-2-hydroxyacid dehydrogenase [Gracilibacillus ureilyticus]SER81647.1 Phosphoglycerate dehydrogenase [Gracilibacillus ureilyticus]